MNYEEINGIVSEMAEHQVCTSPAEISDVITALKKSDSKLGKLSYKFSGIKLFIANRGAQFALTDDVKKLNNKIINMDMLFTDTHKFDKSITDSAAQTLVEFKRLYMEFTAKELDSRNTVNIGVSLDAIRDITKRLPVNSVTSLQRLNNKFDIGVHMILSMLKRYVTRIHLDLVALGSSFSFYHDLINAESNISVENKKIIDNNTLDRLNDTITDMTYTLLRTIRDTQSLTGLKIPEVSTRSRPDLECLLLDISSTEMVGNQTVDDISDYSNKAIELCEHLSPNVFHQIFISDISDDTIKSNILLIKALLDMYFSSMYVVGTHVSTAITELIETIDTIESQDGN